MSAEFDTPAYLRQGHQKFQLLPVFSTSLLSLAHLGAADGFLNSSETLLDRGSGFK